MSRRARAYLPASVTSSTDGWTCADTSAGGLGTDTVRYVEQTPPTSPSVQHASVRLSQTARAGPTSTSPVSSHTPWNNGRLVGQKRALRLRDVWSVRIRLEIGGTTRDPALFYAAFELQIRTLQPAIFEHKFTSRSPTSAWAISRGQRSRADHRELFVSAWGSRRDSA